VPIDPRIALGVQPMQIQQPDPNSGMNALAKIMQLRGLQQESELGRMKMDEYKRGIEDQNALRSALSAPGADPYNILLQRGKLTEANAYRKNQIDADKTAADTEKSRLDAAHKRVDSWGQAMGFVRQNPTPQNAQAAVQHLVTMGVIPPQQAQAAMASAGNDPQAIAQWAEMGFRAALGAKEQLPKFQTNNIGGSTPTQAIDPVTGQTRIVSNLQNTPSPGEVLTDQRGREQFQETKRHNQRMEGFRNSEVNAEGVEYKQDTNGTWLAFPKKAGPGPIQPRAVEGVPGKKEASARNVLTIINEAEKLIDGATGSYLGAAADETARAFGKSTAGAQATAQLKALEGQLMMAMPRMEGPQSNYDVQLYRQMAGQIGDPTVPRETKKAALAKVKALQQQYAGQPEGAWAAPAAGKGTARISGDAEYNALPSGTEFVGPDGKTRRKP
jgi:hypothetical protein